MNPFSIAQYAGYILLACAATLTAAATEQHGSVRFRGFAVPGATVVATQGTTRLETTTDATGMFLFADLANGRWHLKVSMLGFATLETDIEVPATNDAATLTLTMLAREQVLALTTSQKFEQPSAPINGPAAADATAVEKPKPNAAEVPRPQEASQAADGLLVNGSSNNAATSLFSLDRAFGNQRSGSKSLYNAGLALIAGNSVFEARPYSLTGLPQPKASYNKLTEVLSFGGPLNIPHLLNGRMFKGPNLSVVYQRTRDRVQASQTGLVPTTAQRSTVTDPIALALLAYYPLPNLVSNAGYNYQTQVLNNSHVDALQLRLDRGIGQRDQVRGNLALQSTQEDTTDLFGFRDATAVLGFNASPAWQHRLRPGLYLDLSYHFSRLRTTISPFFANRTNVSGDVGIRGTLQDARDWGPPTLTFSSGIATLTDGQSTFNRNRSDGISGALRLYRGRHDITAGGDFRREQINYLQQLNPRGTFTFTGAAFGSDFADFARGVPDTSSVNYGNADKYLRHGVADAFVADDWHAWPELTLNVGVRWEYGAPMTELKQRLVDLDVANGFAAATQVLASNPTGALTGQRYPSSLLRPDRSKVEPRVGLAWRPLPASSLVVRAGYGIYADTSVYQAIALQLATQSPFANSLQVNNADCAQTLRTGPTACGSTTVNTFAVDPNFRVEYAQTWNLSAQRDLPGALVATISYLGVKGTRGVQDFLPNTYPLGAVNPCPSCPVGFRYRASNGNSTRNAGTIQVRRRLRSGLTATLDYTYSRSVDNDSMLGGRGAIATANSSSSQTSSGSVSSDRSNFLAQDWRNLHAERGLSAFDQRNVLNFTAQYTTGMGIGGGTLLGGWPGRAYKEWTVQAQASFGTGLPETPVYLAAVNGTGFTGSIRPDRVAGDVYRGASGHFFNAAAFAAPQAGQWGNAGRNSLRGPGTYTFNSSLSRTFHLEKRLNLDIRANAFNLLNHVVYASYGNFINPTLVSPLFGVPTAGSPMRSLQFTARLRY